MPQFHKHNVCLGKKPAKIDARTLKLEKYFTTVLPVPSASLDLTTKVKKWGMMGNDTIGDCTCAAAGHMIEAWTANAKAKESVPTDKSIIKAYSAVSGYNPVTGANDIGATVLDVLNYWRKKGIGGHKITAYASVDPTNQIHIETAIYLFGGLYIGLQLPICAENQGVWDVPPGGATGNGAPGSWGGHAAILEEYSVNSTAIVTWGELVPATWRFISTYCDEAFAIISNDWIEANKRSPEGFDLQSLLIDLKSV